MLRSISFILLLLLIVTGCSSSSNKQSGNDFKDGSEASRGLQEIIDEGRLVALTDFSSSSYFIYKGVPMGFEYELLERFCDHIGVSLMMKPVDDMDEIITKLHEGEGDIIAANFTITNHRRNEVRFTNPVLETRQVLVQRLPEKWWNYTRQEIDKKLIRNPVKLLNKEVHVRRHSSFYRRLISLMDEIGGVINVKFAEGTGTEQLIEMVSLGEIDYTIADENVAVLNKVYYPNIDVRTPVSFRQNVAWACRPSNKELVDTINHWLKSFQKTETFAVINLKYFKARTQHKERVLSEYSSFKGDKISPFDELIKAEAKRIEWDWKLLAAMIYQESKFVADAEAWTGAGGLMQLIPSTAARFGADSISDPKQNIHAGVSFIQSLQKYWHQHIPDSTQAVPFILASYNVGLGHVLDATRLADKFTNKKYEWESVRRYLELKAQPQYYNDEVVKHGYCRGSEPVNYVKDILLLWEHYKNAPITRAKINSDSFSSSSAS